MIEFLIELIGQFVAISIMLLLGMVCLYLSVLVLGKILYEIRTMDRYKNERITTKQTNIEPTTRETEPFIVSERNTDSTEVESSVMPEL